MIQITFLFGIYFFLFIAFIYNFYLKRRHLPPGPTPLPLIGNMLEIKWNEPGEYCFLKWRKKYGDVFTYWMGELPIVCICDYAKMVETFQRDGDAYAGRQTFQQIADLLRGGISGLVFSEGELWEEQKRFTMHVLRNDFGIGNNRMQERILNEIVAMFAKINAKIERQAADEVNIGELIDIGIGSIINSILFGYRFDEDKLALFQEVKGLLNEQNRLFLQPLSFVLITSWLIHCRNFILFKATYKRMRNSFSQLYDVFDRQIREHLSEIDLDNLDSPPRDYVEAFLREKMKKDATGEKHFYTLQQLKGVCHDLWFAGQETTSVTLAWGIAYLIHNPPVVKRLQAEFDANIGSDRLITVADRSKLQYTNAVINEIQRVANVLPQNIPHKMTKNVTIDGHFIPKGTSIVPQMCVLMIDKEIFCDPTVFRPERFLDENGKLVRINELIPFSIGKRQCLGESLARMELFLFIANIFNQYEVTSGKNAPSLQRKLSGNIACPEFTCKIKKRF